jgi:hypothetical protein
VRLPGDELVGDPVIQVTEGAWIDAPPSEIWPWLLRMGQDRRVLLLARALRRCAAITDVRRAYGTATESVDAVGAA